MSMLVKILSKNTNLDEIFEVISKEGMSYPDFFIALDYYINKLPWCSEDTNTEESRLEAKNKYILVMKELSDLNYHLINKIDIKAENIPEDERAKVITNREKQREAIKQGIGGFRDIIEKSPFKDDLEKYKDIRIRLLKNIQYCEPIIKLVDKMIE